MVAFSLGQKIRQSQTYTENGVRIPVTHISTNHCYVVDIKWPKSNGYFAITLGFGLIKNVRPSVKGQLKKAGIETPLRFLREIRLDAIPGIDASPVEEEGKKGISLGEKKIYIGEQIKSSSLFKKGDLVIVSGISKGKGFQGVVKRHGFAGGPKTHGQSDRWRAPGSIGQTTTPGRVYRGKRMAGRMGGDKVTIKNLEVIDATDDSLVVKGLIPGARGGLLEVRSIS